MSAGAGRLHCVHWASVEPRRASVLIVHGHGEHIGRYDHVASFLVSKGLEVLGFDLRGHGRSDGRRAYVTRFDDYDSDLHQVVRHFKDRYETNRLYLLGHSMGGLIVLRYALAHEGEIAGVLASSPFVVTSVPVPRTLLFLGDILSSILPTLPTLDLSGRPVTHDEAIAASRESDALAYHGRVRARTGNEMRRAGLDLHRRSEDLRLPLYIFHGTEDYLTDWKGSLAVFSKSGSPNKTLTLYRGLYHETLNEVRRDRVLEALASWLDEQLAEINSEAPH